jgi:hypothetical protein
MEIINELIVRRRRGDEGPATIQLLAGDLAAIPREHAVDVLVVSAFPESYTPSVGTLFESLYRRGLDMRDVARRKAEDERARLGCWLSEPLPPEIVEQFHFNRILCFEPRDRRFLETSGLKPDNIEDAVGFVFRCLNNFILPDHNDRRRYEISSVALPLLATGNQRVPVEEMFPRLLDAATFWLEEGLPIERLKVVAFREPAIALARKIFVAAKVRHNLTTFTRSAPSPTPTAIIDRPHWEVQLAEAVSRQVIDTCKRNLRQSLIEAASEEEKKVVEHLFDRVDAQGWASADVSTDDVERYDVFVSYAHKELTEVTEFVDALGQITPPPAVFFDKSSIRGGAQWIRQISDAVQKARIFVAVLSPDYSASPVCWDEFQCAKLKEYTTRQSVIRTVRLRSEQNLPLIMGIYSYIDCAERDLRKLRASAATVVQ